MATKTPRAKKKKSPVKGRRRFSKPGFLASKLLSAGFFVSVGIITLLAFISLELAVICLGFLALGSYVIYAVHQRALWEQSANFKFRDLKQGYDRLTHVISRNQDDIALLKRVIDSDRLDLESTKRGFRPKPGGGSRSQPLHRQPEEQPQQPLAEKPQPRPLSAVHDKPKTPVPKKKIKARTKKPPVVANLDTASDYDGLSDMVVRELLHSAIRNNRINIFVQPIVRLPQRQPRGYEVFGRVRARAGMYLPAQRYMEFAREDKIINDLDSLLLIECIKAIHETAHVTQAAPFFINITSRTITNPRFMKRLLYFISNHRALAPRLVFEIQQQDFENMHPAVLEILRGLGKIGCALSIDHITELDFDIKFLQVLKVRFVKIRAKDLLAKINSSKDFMAMQKLKRKLEGNGIGFIVERIENEKDLIELLDYDINYGQGFLFGRPALQSNYGDQIKKSA